MDARLLVSILTAVTALASARAHSAVAVPEDLAVLPDVATIAARTREPIAADLTSKRLRLLPLRAQASVPVLAKNATAIGTLQLKPFQFTKPTDSSVNFHQQPMGVGLPRQFAHVVMTVDERTYDLFYDTEAADPEFAFRHVSMAVLNDPGSRAVFSVDDSTGRIFGTLYTPTQTYLFEPLNGSEQIVYRAAPPKGKPAADSAGSADPARDLLARRHSQIDLLARLQPHRAQLMESVRRTALQGGELGRMRTQSATAFAAIVKDLGVLTHSSGTEQFVLRDSVTNDDGSRLLRFYQTIGGIPVISENRVRVDRAGKVLTLDVQLNDFPAMQPVLNEQDALARATAHWERVNGRRAEQVEVAEPLMLRYLPKERFESLQLVYAGYVQFDDALPVLARIDAISGDVELLPLAYANDFGYSVCIDKSSTGQAIAQDCGFPIGSSITYYSVDPGSTAHLCPQAGPSICQPFIKQANDELADIDVKWHAATVNNPHYQCCTQVGGSTHHINVIKNSRQVINGQDASFYQHPGKVFMNRASGNNSAEILAHEFVHAQLAYANDIVYVMSTRFAGAFREGMADTIAGLYGAQSFNPALFGTQWIHGDGQLYDGSPLRNGTTARTWSYASKTAEIHDGGQTFFNFFKRLADASGASNQRLLGLALEIQATIADKWGDGLDPYDFKDAALGAVQPSETALKNAINSVWDAMYDVVASGPVSPPGPPGEPGPTGAPTFPALVFSTFQYCGIYLGSNVSVFSLGWSTTSNTTEYLGYVKMASEPLYRYQFTAPHPQAAAVGWSNTTGDFRVRSCNGAGCSGLSLSAASLNQQPQCF